MEEHECGTGEDQFHHIAVPLQEVGFLDELDVHAEEESAQSVAAEEEAAAQGAHGVREELDCREDEEVEVAHGEEGAQSEDGHAVDQGIAHVEVSQFEHSQQDGQHHQHDAAPHNHALPPHGPGP